MTSTPSLSAKEKFTSDWYSRKGLVYFVSAGSGCEICRSIKIGVSTREGLLRRLRGIQSANHTQIRLLRLILTETMKKAEDEETEWHRRFRVLARVPRSTVGCEWFSASPELMEDINNLDPLDKEIKGIENRDDRDAIVKLFVGD